MPYTAFHVWSHRLPHLDSSGSVSAETVHLSCVKEKQFNLAGGGWDLRISHGLWPIPFFCLILVFPLSSRVLGDNLAFILQATPFVCLRFDLSLFCWDIPLFSIYLLTSCDVSVFFFHVLERVLSSKEGSSGYWNRQRRPFLPRCLASPLG